jgi:hypothetical protein
MVKMNMAANMHNMMCMGMCMYSIVQRETEV